MKLPQIISTLTTEPLFCRSGYRETLLEILAQHASMSAAEYKHARSGRARSGDNLEVEQMEIVDGIARIPVGGPIRQQGLAGERPLERLAHQGLAEGIRLGGVHHVQLGMVLGSHLDDIKIETRTSEFCILFQD